MTLPASTCTSFDDLTRITSGDRFVLNGYEYRADADAVTARTNGFEAVTIPARRRHPAMPSGWELATVIESRPVPIEAACRRDDIETEPKSVFSLCWPVYDSQQAAQMAADEIEARFDIYQTEVRYSHRLQGWVCDAARI